MEHCLESEVALKQNSALLHSLDYFNFPIFSLVLELINTGAVELTEPAESIETGDQFKFAGHSATHCSSPSWRGRLLSHCA
jgi:hypothetical protein